MPRRRAYGRRESKVERLACSMARAWLLVVSKLRDPTGIMDHVFWVPGGRPLLVEFKDPEGKTAKGRAKLQAFYRKTLSEQGYRTAVITTLEEFSALMKEYGYE
jgi:hypothetical protein